MKLLRIQVFQATYISTTLDSGAHITARGPYHDETAADVSMKEGVGLLTFRLGLLRFVAPSKANASSCAI